MAIYQLVLQIQINIQKEANMDILAMVQLMIKKDKLEHLLLILIKKIDNIHMVKISLKQVDKEIKVSKMLNLVLMDLENLVWLISNSNSLQPKKYAKNSGNQSIQENYLKKCLNQIDFLLLLRNCLTGIQNIV